MSLNRVQPEYYAFRQVPFPIASQEHTLRTVGLPDGQDPEGFTFFPYRWVLNSHLLVPNGPSFFNLVRAVMNENAKNEEGLTVLSGLGNLAIGAAIDEDQLDRREYGFQHSVVDLVQDTNEQLNAARSPYEVELFTPDTVAFGGVQRLKTYVHPPEYRG